MKITTTHVAIGAGAALALFLAWKFILPKATTTPVGAGGAATPPVGEKNDLPMLEEAGATPPAQPTTTPPRTRALWERPPVGKR